VADAWLVWDICVTAGWGRNLEDCATDTAEWCLLNPGYHAPPRQPSIVKQLIDQGADVTAKNWLRWTPLMIAGGLYLS
jgi:ankyrin repeat protein